jgi:multidrug efflux system membrane fusion protein
MRASIIIVCLAALLGGLWWKREDALRFAAETAPFLAGYLGSASSAPPAPAAAARPVPVMIAQAEVKRLPVTIDAVATVQPVASIAIKPRIDSQIVEIAVQEGAKVKEGDLLVRLDARALKAQLAQADAQIVKGRAQMAQLRRDLARADELLAKRISSEVQRDAAATAVKVQEAQIAADEAQRDNLLASVTYTEIRAPVSGRIGSIPLKVGSSVRAGDAQAIATVNQIDPIYVSFAVPQALFGDLRAALALGPVKVDARVGTEILSGTVAFVENTVDLATGTVLAKAIFPNPQERLWPGGFVTVQAVLGVESAAVTVPSSVVQLGQRGPFLFVVRERRRAELVQVAVARTSGSDSVITSGLKGGEDVVVEGQLRLVDGAPIQVQPGQAPVPTAPSARTNEGLTSDAPAARRG